MKKLLFLIVVILIFSSVLFTSCLSEKNESENVNAVENDYETDIDEPNNNIWNEFDFLIMTDYPNSYNGAPVACPPYWRDNTGEMSISDMLASIDDTAFVFALPAVEGLYLKFSYNSDITPAEIKDAYYINGNNETEHHYLNLYLDEFMKVPEETGVYNFFVNLEWNDGAEEIVYFRVEIVESHESYNNRLN